MRNIYDVVREFEKELCKYTGAPYAVAIDNCSNALFLSLMYQNLNGREVRIPKRTYPSVPCAIIQAGGRVVFNDMKGETIRGAYFLENTKTIDSALMFTHEMYLPEYFMCLSFTGPYKHLKLIKGGAILTDSKAAYEWFKRARYSGRNECSYHEDNFTQLGWNFYMDVATAARGVLLMKQFYTPEGEPIYMADKELKYPDLSKYKIYKTWNI